VPRAASKRAEIPVAGYIPRRVYASELELKLRSPADIPDGADAAVSFTWNWQFSGDDMVNVVFGIRLDATPERPEDVRAVMIGAFTTPLESPIALDAFVSGNAIVMLFPFLREAVASLTMHGGHGPHVLPLINTVRLSTQLEKRATDGFRQLQADTRLRSRWQTRLSPEFIAALDEAGSVEMARTPSPSRGKARSAGARTRRSKTDSSGEM